MVNYHNNLFNTLNKILPTKYELTLTSKSPIPCISFMEMNNYSFATGDTLEYSRINYQIKVWGNKIDEINEYALKIDKALRPLGFNRISCGMLHDNQSGMIQKIMTYEALAFESFD